MGPRGDLAVLYWSRNRYFGTPLVLLDWDVEPLRPGAWLRAEAKLDGLARTNRARAASLGLWVETDAMLQAARAEGAGSARLVPKHATARAFWQELGLAAAVQLRAGNVGVTRAALDKRDALADVAPCGALRYNGEDRGDDATVPAYLYGVALGLDEATARIPLSKLPVRRPPR